MEIRLFAYLIVGFGLINLFRMALFLIGSDIYGLFSSKRKKRPTSYQPSFTIIIPAHNEQGTIIRAVESVFANHYPSNKLQVIVADDGSTDQTAALVAEYQNHHPGLSLRLVSQPNSGKARALNHAIKNYAVGELVMCLDADSFLSSSALQHTARYFQNSRVAAMSANVHIIPGPGLLNYLQRFEYLVCYQMKRAESLFNCEYIVGGIGSTFRKTVLEKVGYYDTDTVTEDIDLTMKILRLGNKEYQAVYGADVVVNTEAVLSVSGLLRQRYRWKWGRCQTFLKNMSMFFSPDRKYTKSLSWFYLPFALYGDIAYFLEPILFAYIVYVSVYFHDPFTLVSSWLVITSYLVLNVLAEDTLTFTEKLIFLLGSPFMYALMYILSFVEYVALIRAIYHSPGLKASLDENVCGWQHVSRPTPAPVYAYSYRFRLALYALIVFTLISVSTGLVLSLAHQENPLPQETSPLPSSTPAPSPIPLPSRLDPRTLSYVVRPGDTLWSLAQRFYGNGALWPRFHHSIHIYPGEILQINL